MIETRGASKYAFSYASIGGKVTMTLAQEEPYIRLRVYNTGAPIDQKDLESYPPLLAQFLLLMRTRRMQPKVIVAYDRIPYVDRRGNVRITFDRNIAASVDFSHFFEEEMQKIPLLPPGEHLLEVKYDEYLPAVLKQQLDLGKLRQETFSKYYLCRKRAGNEHFFEHL